MATIGYRQVKKCLGLFVTLVALWTPSESKHIPNSSPSDPIIDTIYGPVRGFLEKVDDIKVANFLGIPYAMPPINALRFKKSKQLNHTWTEPYAANKQPQSCFQAINIAVAFEVGRDDGAQVSEDCLYLNIFAPKLTNGNKDEIKSDLKPVLVFIHGGGFHGGSVSQPVYNGKTLAAMGEIVVVTVNFRVGVFGFLYTGPTEQDAPGNQAIWDVLNAVYWVNKNIEKFGGDPSKITLAGHGSGGIMVSMASQSPAFEKLIQNWIIMSGSDLNSFIEPKAVAKLRADKIAYQLGCTSKDNLFNDCFKNADSHMLSLLSQSRLIAPSFDTRIYNLFHIVPMFGGSILPMRPGETIQVYPKKKRFLMGAVDFEGTTLLEFGDILSFDPRILRYTNSDNRETWKLALEEMIKNDIHQINGTKLQEIVNYYFENSRNRDGPDDEGDRTKWLMDVLQFWGDHNLLCPLKIQAQRMAENKNEVFFYRFSYVYDDEKFSKHCKGYNKSCHGAEIPLMFQVPFSEPNSYTDNDRDAAGEMLDVLIAFMRDDDIIPKLIPGKDFTAYNINPVISEDEKIIHNWKQNICDLLEPYILEDAEQDQKISQDQIGIAVAQSPWGLLGTYLNGISAVIVSHGSQLGHSLMPFGRALRDMYKDLVAHMDDPSINNVLHTISSWTGLTGYF